MYERDIEVEEDVNVGVVISCGPGWSQTLKIPHNISRYRPQDIWRPALVASGRHLSSGAN